VRAHDDALRKRIERGHREPPPQLRMADEHDADPVLGVHRVVGQEAQVLEYVGAQVVGLVDDEDRAEAVLGAPARDLSADVLEERGAVALGRQAELACRGPSRCRS